jgi:hypothetical protein
MYFFARFFTLLSTCRRVSSIHRQTRHEARDLQVRELQHAAIVVVFREEQVAHASESGATEAAGHGQEAAFHSRGDNLAAERFAEGELVCARESGHAQG